jgi:hypothetical protein
MLQRSPGERSSKSLDFQRRNAEAPLGTSQSSERNLLAGVEAVFPEGEIRSPDKLQHVHEKGGARS